MGKNRIRGKDFSRHYEGPEVLGELIQLAGSPYSLDQVIEKMREAQEAGEQAGDLIPELFEGEPQFGDPLQAQLTFQNLLGLWDLLATGQPLPRQKVPRPPKPKKPEPVHPGEFEDEGPSEDWVETAWTYLEDISERERTKRVHAFENRQDALLTHLDEVGLSDNGYLVARHLLLELHSMIELGWPAGVVSVDERTLTGKVQQGGKPVPQALISYVEEAIFEAEQDEEAPLPPEEVGKLRDTVGRLLGALWNARRP